MESFWADKNENFQTISNSPQRLSIPRTWWETLLSISDIHHKYKNVIYHTSPSTVSCLLSEMDFPTHNQLPFLKLSVVCSTIGFAFNFDSNHFLKTPSLLGAFKAGRCVRKRVCITDNEAFSPHFQRGISSSTSQKRKILDGLFKPS